MTWLPLSENEVNSEKIITHPEWFSCCYGCNKSNGKASKRIHIYVDARG